MTASADQMITTRDAFEREREKMRALGRVLIEYCNMPITGNLLIDGGLRQVDEKTGRYRFAAALEEGTEALKIATTAGLAEEYLQTGNPDDLLGYGAIYHLENAESMVMRLVDDAYAEDTDRYLSALRDIRPIDDE